jgi:TfoX/Sxy family transcriptional regulator of competence genes
MSYDEHLAERIRDLLVARPDVTEKKMFGGLAFLVDGSMAIAASGLGGALVRVDPARSAALVARSNAEPAIMRGRPMDGWLRVSSSDLRTSRQLAKWVGVAAACLAAAKHATKSPRRATPSRISASL